MFERRWSACLQHKRTKDREREREREIRWDVGERGKEGRKEGE